MEVSGQFHTSAALPQGKEPHGIHWIGGCVGPRTGLDAVEKRKCFDPCLKSNTDTSAVQPIVLRYTDWAIPALSIYIQGVPEGMCQTSGGCSLC
jgi:hypothetical protein